jgi:Domain of unknown function (DUF4410)
MVAKSFKSYPGALVAALLSLFLVGCSTRVVNTGTFVPTADSSPLPRPQRVIIADFAAEPADVRLDQGIGPRVLRQIDGGTSAAESDEALASVRSAVSDALVESVRKMGLPAERGTVRSAPGELQILVQGQLERINEGNRTRRLAIGFGAGKSDVRAAVQVYYIRPNMPPQLLQTYDADANSGRKPGMAAAGASAAGGNLGLGAFSAVTGVHSEGTNAGVAAEGEHLANRVAYNLGQFFKQRGWIPASAVPTPSLR